MGMGTDKEAVPVAGFTVNFSSMPRIAPPPLGRVIAGGLICGFSPIDSLENCFVVIKILSENIITIFVCV
jgi:hypothetical protein